MRVSRASDNATRAGAFRKPASQTFQEPHSSLLPCGRTQQYYKIQSYDISKTKYALQVVAPRAIPSAATGQLPTTVQFRIAGGLPVHYLGGAIIVQTLCTKARTTKSICDIAASHPAESLAHTTVCLTGADPSDVQPSVRGILFLSLGFNLRAALLSVFPACAGGAVCSTKRSVDRHGFQS